VSRAAAGPAPPLIERRLWFVLGKGGSGKSTVSATLGLTAALAGRRTLLMEVAGQNRVSAIFAGASVGHERPVELRPGDGEGALAELQQNGARVVTSAAMDQAQYAGGP